MGCTARRQRTGCVTLAPGWQRNQRRAAVRHEMRRGRTTLIATTYGKSFSSSFSFRSLPPAWRTLRHRRCSCGGGRHWRCAHAATVGSGTTAPGVAPAAAAAASF